MIATMNRVAGRPTEKENRGDDGEVHLYTMWILSMTKGWRCLHLLRSFEVEGINFVLVSKGGLF